MKTISKLHLVMAWAVVGILIWLPAPVSAQGGFKAGCTLPYAQIASPADPLASCGNCGVVSATAKPADAAAKAAQSQAKNNLCGNLSAKIVVDFNILAQMQALSSNKSKLANRQILHQVFSVGGKKIGEGDVVQLKAFVHDAHISNCDAGEEVNCDLTGAAVNDIHIPLLDPNAGNPQTQDECSSVTAEMIPHFRPAAWSQIDMKTPVQNVVRVTGQLFFDDSHDPCEKNPDGTFTRHTPARISLWEIHPVYAFDVCKNADAPQCDVADDSVWIPYDQWVAQPGAVTQATGDKIRQQCVAPHGKPSQPIAPVKPAQCPTTANPQTKRRPSTHKAPPASPP
jgi:hypothetical protein